MTASLNDSVSKDNVVPAVNETASSTNKLLGHLYEEKTEGDEGINSDGEIHVGRPTDGKESVFGQGDSHTTGMLVFTTQDDITYIDNTEAAKSASGSPWAAFGGTGMGASFYIGSDLPICGAKIKVATLLDPGPTGSVAREFWNGSSWDAFTAMATASDPPYTQRADNIGTVVGSEQVRIGECDDQVQNTVNGELKYWVRFRITSAIVSDGTNEQIKLHTNRFEINEDGFTEYFGDGIYTKDLLMHWHLTEELVGFSPQNQSISFASGITLAYTNNKLNSGQTSGRGGYVEIPEGMDTSRPVIGELLFIPLDDTAGFVRFESDTYQTAVGDTLTVANTPTSKIGDVTIEAGSSNVLHKVTFEDDVQNLVPGEILTFGVKRLGAADSYSGAIAVVSVRAIGSFWKP